MESIGQLKEMKSIFLTHHFAGSAGNERFRLGEYMMEEALRYAKGEPLRCEVTLKMLETMA